MYLLWFPVFVFFWIFLCECVILHWYVFFALFCWLFLFCLLCPILVCFYFILVLFFRCLCFLICFLIRKRERKKDRVWIWVGGWWGGSRRSCLMGNCNQNIVWKTSIFNIFIKKMKKKRKHQPVCAIVINRD